VLQPLAVDDDDRPGREVFDLDVRDQPRQVVGFQRVERCLPAEEVHEFLHAGPPSVPTWQ